MIDLILYRMIEYFDNDVKRINHAFKVYALASVIANKERVSANTLQIIKISSILHDIGIKEAERKYNSSNGHYQELEGPGIAKKLLADLKINYNSLERILFLIGNHHSYNKIDGTDFQILIEADFLVNISEEKMSKDAINSIRLKYFKTTTGIKLLESMFNDK